MTWLLLALAPGVAWSGPVAQSAPSQEEESPEESDDPLVEPRPGRHLPRRPEQQRAVDHRYPPHRGRWQAVGSRAVRQLASASIWRPSPLLAEPEPPNPQS